MRKQTNEDRALVDLANAWNGLCPEADKSFPAKLLRDMRTESKLNKAKALCGRLYDGLAYGNWPSNMYVTVKE